MTIKAHLEAIRDALADWARAHGGLVDIASDPNDAGLRIQAGPGKPLALPHFLGEEPFDEDSERTGLVTRNFTVVIVRAMGLAIDGSQSLMETLAGAAPFYELLEDARTAIRNLRIAKPTGVSTGMMGDRERCPFNLTTRLWRVGQVELLNVYEINFSLVTRT
jgi:hypothetical protein